MLLMKESRSNGTSYFFAVRITVRSHFRGEISVICQPSLPTHMQLFRDVLATTETMFAAQASQTPLPFVDLKVPDAHMTHSLPPAPGPHTHDALSTLAVDET
jgi:hypothetical protein